MKKNWLTNLSNIFRRCTAWKHWLVNPLNIFRRCAAWKHWLVNPLNIFLIAGISLLITQHWIPTLIISVLYYATRNKQIKSPGFGIIYFFNKAIKRVGPGLCLLLPGVYIEKRKGKEFSVSFGDENVLTGENNIGIGIEGTIWLRENPEFGDLDNLLKLSENEAEEKAREAANTTLEKEVAERSEVIKLLIDKDDIRKAIKKNVIEAMGGTLGESDKQQGGAYIVERIQLADTDAKTLTDAARIREQGKASAKSAQSLKDALGDNAYIPQAIAEGGRAIVEATANIAGAMANRGKDSNGAIDELNSTMKHVAEKLDEIGGNHG